MIDRLLPLSDPLLEAMTDAIVQSVHPARVILFGSRARGDGRPDSDYDLVVEMAFERAAYHATYGRITAALRNAKNGASVDVLIRTPGEIERKRDDPGYMDWAIARDGLIIYPPGTDHDLLRPQFRGAVRENERFPSIAEWLARASQDTGAIRGMLDSMHPVAWAAVAFHAQQIAEKHLKVLFIVQHARPPRTHQLTDIIRDLAGFGYDLSHLLTDAALLEPYGVGIRYPGDVVIPDEPTGRRVLAAADRIVAAVKAALC